MGTNRHSLARDGSRRNEVARCNPATEASDWCAVGAMMYEVLTGRFPIQGTPIEIILRKQKETPVDPRGLEPSTRYNAGEGFDEKQPFLMMENSGCCNER